MAKITPDGSDLETPSTVKSVSGGEFGDKA